MTSARGRDVSDFEPVQAVSSWAGYAFGIAKATEGLSWTAKTFPANWANLEACVTSRSDFPLRGAYHFLHPGQDPAAQARHFVSVVKAAGLLPGDMLACDSELLAGVIAAVSGEGSEELPLTIGMMPRRASLTVTAADLALSLAAVDAATLAFCDQVRALAGPHHPIVVYTMHAVGRHLARTAAKYPLWLAWPSAAPPPAAMVAPWKSWLLWQDSWSSPGGGDGDRFSGDVAALAAWASGYRRTGPFRHVAAGESLNQIAARRHTTARHLLDVSLAAYTGEDIAALLAAPLDGVPYYSSNP